MKIIDIAICIDNKDPENLGRIRCVRYSSYTGEVERALNYEPWDDNDLFTATPFLPTNINFIPEIGQTVKILNYDTDKDTVNVEYIAGPFTTRHDFNSQTHSIQIEKSSYGILSKHGKNIMSNGDFINPKSIGSFAKDTHYGIYGKYGSDVIFTEDGLVLRGGKLISKQNANETQKFDMLYEPIMSNKQSILHLKKYPYTYVVNTSEFEIEDEKLIDIDYFVEYDIDNFTGNTFTIYFYVYKITKKYEKVYTNQNTLLLDTDLIPNTFHLLTLNNQDFTFSKTTDNIENVYKIIRTNLRTLHLKGLKEINNEYKVTTLNTFYYRPKKECRIRELTNIENTNRLKIFNNISVNTKDSVYYGIVYPINSSTLNLNTKRKKPKLEVKDKTTEQTFSSLRSDKIYLISTENVNKTPINHEKLNKYELTQENYLQDIDPHTFSLVRGEPLLKFLRAMFDVLTTHIHNINSPYARNDYNQHKILEDLYKNLENDILNNSIKLN